MRIEFGKPRAEKAERRFQGYNAEPKIDGWRARIDYHSDEQFIVSGHRSDFTVHLRDRIVLPTAGVYDAEIVVNESLQGTASVLSRRSRCDIDSLDVYVFDALELEQMDTSQISYQNRRSLLEGLDWTYPVQLIESIPIYERKRIDEIAWPFIEDGYEGVVLKGPLSRYGEDWHKYKRRSSREFVVTRFEMGKGEWAGTVGAIHITDAVTGMPAGKCSVGSNANRVFFTDLLNKPLTEHGRTGPVVVEVEYQQITRDGRLRHPRLVRVRHDLMGTQEGG